ncbi:MAG: D-alanyl-D-alanine carboxypeptidase [Pseudomonadota bacterium]|nr:D-alanyl-D-alanine carboxypeptidase [Pseudomonadota bacterium]
MMQTLRSALALALLFVGLGAAKAAEPYLVADAQTGEVLMQNDASEPWFPASTTKLMTVYVALNAVHDGRLTMDTPLKVSARAARMPASKMGFRPGTLVTLDNALKMLMVKSPNDIAVTVAEGVSGSVEDFAAEMNATAKKLGMHESHFVNPNGLHNEDHYSSARDMAILARALLKDFPDETGLYSIGALQLGDRIIRNHNGLIGRYPGADGMKTGFTCPAGWNVVATAQRQGRRLIVVVFGAPSPRLRTNEAAMLFDRGFAMSGTGQTLDALPAAAVTEPPNMRDVICRGRGRAAMIAMQEDFVASAVAESSAAFATGRNGVPMLAAAMEAPPAVGAIADEKVTFDPVPVFIGAKPGWTGPILAARGAAEEEETSPVSAYSAQKDAKAPEAEAAKAALKSVVKPPVRLKGGHLTPQARARKAAATRRVAAKKTQ